MKNSYKDKADKIILKLRKHEINIKQFGKKLSKLGYCVMCHKKMQIARVDDSEWLKKNITVQKARVDSSDKISLFHRNLPNSVFGYMKHTSVSDVGYVNLKKRL